MPKIFNHVSDIADFDNYGYFGIKGYEPVRERNILKTVFGLAFLAIGVTIMVDVIRTFKIELDLFY